MTMLFKFFSNLIPILGIIFVFKAIKAQEIVIDRIYLIVNSQMITRSEALDHLTNLKSHKSTQVNPKQQLEKKLLMDLIQELLLLDRADSLKINISSKEIDNRFKKLSEKQPKILEVYSEEDIREQIARELKKHKVMDREVISKIHIESSEISIYCKQQILKNREIGLAQILLKKGTEREIKKNIEKIHEEFKNGVKFEELAKKYSSDLKAKITGGRLGMFKTTDLLPEIGDVASKLEPGIISNLVKTKLGYHLLYIYEEKFQEKINCENIKPDKQNLFYDSLYNYKRNSLLEKYINELYACSKIELKDPGYTGLPGSDFLPNLEKIKVNCQDKRIMILPKKEKKPSPKRNP